MDDEQLKQFLTADQQTPAAEAPVVADTVQTPAPQTVTEPAKADTPVPDETAVLRERLANLQQVYGRQTAELGEMRRVFDTYKPFLDELNNPAFHQHVTRYFDAPAQTQPAQTPTQAEVDPFNPESISRLVEQTVVRTLTARERAALAAQQKQAQVNLLTKFNTNLNAGIAKLIENGVPQDEATAAMQNFMNRFIEGDVADFAIKMNRFDRLLAEAETRGRQAGEEAARKSLADLANNPVRTAAAGGRQVVHTNVTNTNATTLEEIETPQQLEAYAATLKAFSPQWKAAMKFAETRGWM
jgi:hypothetical protein